MMPDRLFQVQKLACGRSEERGFATLGSTPARKPLVLVFQYGGAG